MYAYKCTGLATLWDTCVSLCKTFAKSSLKNLIFRHWFPKEMRGCHGYHLCNYHQQVPFNRRKRPDKSPINVMLSLSIWVSPDCSCYMSINQSINQSNFCSANIPGKARFSGATGSPHVEPIKGSDYVRVIEQWLVLVPFDQTSPTFYSSYFLHTFLWGRVSLVARAWDLQSEKSGFESALCP